MGAARAGYEADSRTHTKIKDQRINDDIICHSSQTNKSLCLNQAPSEVNLSVATTIIEQLKSLSRVHPGKKIHSLTGPERNLHTLGNLITAIHLDLQPQRLERLLLSLRTLQTPIFGQSVNLLLVELEALKNIGIIHMDLKPHNIMFVNHKDQPFKIKLNDFGLALQLLANETSDPAMKAVLCLAALAVFVCSVESKYSPPKVQLYSRDPGENGKDNTLICHVSDFHPPDITIQLMKDGVELPNAKLTDLSFKQNWQFHLTKSVPFLPNDGQMYSCKVTHGSNVKDYAWERYKNLSISKPREGETMETIVCALVLGLLGSSLALESQPRVQVYSRVPGEFGKVNSLICHVCDFHPPVITIELLRDGAVMARANQTDLVFEDNWHFQLTKSAPFTPKEGEKFTCRVTHMGKPRTYSWATT
ncbi:Beta-2-microglobulin [Scophthalmus maximus]|uniref:Beta-2-microglobulin n=1 Tax=Scophthalmus maximus TaxID=52904 RepID=A0A2U9BAZ3_SCOMX|nr:Beta-2-microglobulin [Scophthalmus maximus]